MGLLLPIWGQRLGTRRFPIYHCHVGSHMAAEGGEVLTLMASSCNIDVFMTPCTATCSSSAVWNSTTDSIAKVLLWGECALTRCKSQWCPPPGWRRHQMECHCPWLIPKCTYDLRDQLHHLEYDLLPLRQSLWKWETSWWGKGRFVKISMVDSENSGGFHKWRWNQQILEQ